MSLAQQIRNLKGENGGHYINDTVAHTPTSPNIYFDTFTALTACVIASAINEAGSPGGNAFTAVTVPAGTTIFGLFKSITLTSGTGMAYHRA